MLNQHQTIRDSIVKYNKIRPFEDYLLPYIKGKYDVKILDVASGPFCKIGTEIPHIFHLILFCIDNQDFTNFYKKYKVTPVIPIRKEDMEKMTFPDKYFDLVHCANALDHTKDAYKAVEEMIRVCKKGGWVYIECYLDQLDTGHLHKWNVSETGTFSNNHEVFDLKNFGFSIKYEENPLGRRYSKIVATLHK